MSRQEALGLLIDAPFGNNISAQMVELMKERDISLEEARILADQGIHAESVFVEPIFL